ncbi:hypothetical protein D9M68_801740 [compost metagenome]
MRFTTISVGEEAIAAMPEKSLSVSYGILSLTAGMTTYDEDTNSMVFLSTGSFSVRWAPTSPPAPGLFSTTTAWPSSGPSFSA